MKLSRILIIDDERMQRELIKELLLLSDIACQAYEAEDGSQGLDMLASEEYDIVLIDKRMPVMNGDEVCRCVRENLKLKLLPIIMVTGIHDTAELSRSFTAGVTDFITKPYDPVEIISRIKSALATKLLTDQLDNAKTAFLANMSHELRTPLNAILGFAQLLEMDNQRIAPEEHQEYVREILKGGRYLLELINKVLDLSRIESGHVELTQEFLSLSELIRDTLLLVQPQADKQEVSLSPPSFEYGEQPDELIGDRLRLEQVLLNLLSNAIKFNRKGGKVELIGTRSGDHFRIEVRDTGQGIPAEYQDRVFKAFERLGAEERAIEGTGIGLALSKHLIESMGGRINFESTPGIGSTFWFELPATPANPG